MTAITPNAIHRREFLRQPTTGAMPAKIAVLVGLGPALVVGWAVDKASASEALHFKRVVVEPLQCGTNLLSNPTFERTEPNGVPAGWQWEKLWVWQAGDESHRARIRCGGREPEGLAPFQLLGSRRIHSLNVKVGEHQMPAAIVPRSDGVCAAQHGHGANHAGKVVSGQVGLHEEEGSRGRCVFGGVAIVAENAVHGVAALAG
jgi:hypothetical protein